MDNGFKLGAHAVFKVFKHLKEMLWDLKVNEDLLGIIIIIIKTRKTTGGQKKGFGYNKAY